jgi:hypothetical protein
MKPGDNVIVKPKTFLPTRVSNSGPHANGRLLKPFPRLAMKSSDLRKAIRSGGEKTRLYENIKDS